METIGNLTGGLAHDFNNLLTVIIGNLDLLQDLTKNNPDQKRQVELVLEASLRGAELTRQLLAFSRRQPLQPKIADLDELIGKTSCLRPATLRTPSFTMAGWTPTSFCCQSHIGNRILPAWFAWQSAAR